MKRHLSRRRLMLLLAACVIPVINCSAAVRAVDRYVEPSGAATAWASNMRHSFQYARLADTQSAGAAAYFGDVPITVIGVYGATMLDMLSGGPLLLVKWPNDCCSPGQSWHTRWHAQSAPADSRAEGTHIFFLWRES